MPITTRSVEVPDTDPPLSVTIRRLSYKQVKDAKDARLSEVMSRASQAREFSDLLKGINPEAAAQATQTAREQADDPTQLYDLQRTLHAGIVAWNYAEDPKPSNIDDLLGEQEADFIFRQIVAFTERTADERKDSPLSFVPASAGAAEAAGLPN